MQVHIQHVRPQCHSVGIRRKGVPWPELVEARRAAGGGGEAGQGGKSNEALKKFYYFVQIFFKSPSVEYSVNNQHN